MQSHPAKLHAQAALFEIAYAFLVLWSPVGSQAALMKSLLTCFFILGILLIETAGEQTVNDRERERNSTGIWQELDVYYLS